MLGLSGLQRAGYNSLSFSFSDLGLTTASDFEIKKGKKKKKHNETQNLELLQQLTPDFSITECKVKFSSEGKG